VLLVNRYGESGDLQDAGSWMSDLEASAAVRDELRWKAGMSTVRSEDRAAAADADAVDQTAVEASERIAELPCVRVFIQTGNVSLNLQTPIAAAANRGGDQHRVGGENLSCGHGA